MATNLDLKKKMVSLIGCTFFYFEKFRCSLKCRLNHYKEFKRRISGETTLGCRNSILLDKYVFEE